MTENQHGFTKDTGTEANRLFFYFTLAKLRSKRTKVGTIDVFFIDFEKAFDKISHSYIAKSLEENGVHQRLTDWYYDYFGANETDRTMRIKVGNSYSNPKTITSGNIQGSLSGPDLFNIAIEPLIRGIIKLNEDDPL